jgi:hypothetical protein
VRLGVHVDAVDVGQAHAAFLHCLLLFCSRSSSFLLISIDFDQVLVALRVLASLWRLHKNSNSSVLKIEIFMHVASVTSSSSVQVPHHAFPLFF